MKNENTTEILNDSWYLPHQPYLHRHKHRHMPQSLVERTGEGTNGSPYMISLIHCDYIYIYYIYIMEFQDPIDWRYLPIF